MAARKKKPVTKKKPVAKALGNDPFARGAAARELKTAAPPTGPRERAPTPELQERARKTPSTVKTEPAAAIEPATPPMGSTVVSAAIAEAKRKGHGTQAVSRRAQNLTQHAGSAVVSAAIAEANALKSSGPIAHASTPAFGSDPAAHHASPQLSADPAAHHASPEVVADPAAHHASPHVVVDPIAHHEAPTADLIDGPVPHFSSPTVFDATPFESSPTLIGPAPTPPPPPFESSPTMVATEPAPFGSSLATASQTTPAAAEGGFLGTLLAAVRAGVGLASRTTQIDHWGKDATLAASLRPLGDLLYDRYFRVQVEGAQHLPSGPCVIVANHAGALPLDGPLLHLAIRRERPELAESRWLLEDQIFHAPFAGVLANRLGAVRANPENAHRLLDEGRPIIVFPEGFHGLSKPFSERYQLRRFGRGGYVKIAVRRGVPIVPVAIVGGEESMPLLAKIPAKFLGVEHLPITPPPLPTKWFIRFSPAFDLSDAPEQAETNLAWVERTNLSVRDQIEAMITDLLKQRQSVF